MEGKFLPLTEEEKRKALQLIRDNYSMLDTIKEIISSRHKNEIDYLYNAIAITYNELSN